MVNTPAVQSTASIVSVMTQRHPTTVEIIHVVQRQCPSSRRSRRSLSYHGYCSWMRSWGARCDERQVRATQARRTPGSCHRSRAQTRSLVFPWRCNIRFPQFQCGKRQLLAIQMCSKTTRRAPTRSPLKGTWTSQL